MKGRDEDNFLMLRHLFSGDSHSGPYFEDIELDKTATTLANYYKAFIQHYPGTIILFALDGEIITSNKDFSTNYFIERFKNKSEFSHILSDIHYDTFKQAFYVATKGVSEQVEVDFTYMDGESVRFSITFIPVGTSTIEAVYALIDNKTPIKLSDTPSELDIIEHSAQIGTFEYSIAKDEIVCSSSCYKLFGLEKGKRLTLKSLLEIVLPENYNVIESAFELAARSHSGNHVAEFRVRHGQSNELRYLKLNLIVVDDGEITNDLIGVVTDHTEQQNLHDRLREINERYHHIFEHLHAGIWMRKSKGGKYMYASKGLEDIFNIPLSQIYKEPDSLRRTILPEYHLKLRNQYALLNQGNSIESRFRIEDKQGQTKWLLEQIVPRINDDGEITHLFGMITDITKVVEMEQKLEFIAKYDQLTSLPNLYSLHDQIDTFIKDEHVVTFALLHMDIDNFKWINDFLGHPIGDRVLKLLAKRLMALTTNETYIAKTESDSFVFISTNCEQKEDTFKLAKQIMDVVKQRIIVEGYELYVTASIGISFYPSNGMEKLILLENAHTALYHAKKLGKNNFQIYSFDKDISTHKKYMLEQDLRIAIEREEFDLYYQPKVNPITNVLEGAEALIRWPHEKWGLVSPAEFIPLAEEKHLIHMIDSWVIRTVCQHIHRWREQGYSPLPISINISPIHFLKPGLLSTLQEELQQASIPPNLITLEITERFLLDNEQHISQTMDTLKLLGVRLAIDDFGTGYSSFQYLQQFNLDILKIDKSFIQKISSDKASDNRNNAIVSSFIHVARELDMEVVAEGVEEEDQLQFLIEHDCDLIQGFIYSRPLPKQEFEQFFENNYIPPQSVQKRPKVINDQRDYFRFTFPSHLPANVQLKDNDLKNEDIGATVVLLENIGIGGIKFLSKMELPVVSSIKLVFQFNILGETFDLSGTLMYKNDEKTDVYSYGASFHLTSDEKHRLADVINKLSTSYPKEEYIPDTELIEVHPYLFLQQHG